MTHPDFGKPFPCECQRAQLEQRHLDKIFVEAGVPARFQAMSFETFTPYVNEANYDAYQFVDVMARYDAVEDPKSGLLKAGVLLYGFFGVGKSGLAAASANTRIAAGMPVLWIDYLRFIKRVQATYGKKTGPSAESVIEAGQHASFLVLDDLGDASEGGRPITADQRNILYQLLGYRHQEVKPTLITTNLEPGQLEAQLGPRVYQRVVELCHFVPMGGEVLRK